VHGQPLHRFSTLLTDNRDLDLPRYHPRLLEMAGVDGDKLPTLVAVNSRIGTLRGEVAAELGLPATAAVFSGTNDTQAASVAAGSFRPGPGGVNIGSTAQILASMPGKRTDLQKGLFTMPSPIRGRRLVLAENGLAGKSLEHFIRNVVFARDALADHSAEDPFGRIEQALGTSPAGSGGLLFLPWLTGTESPATNDRVRGAFLNISLETGREQMLRAILEGVAFILRWLREAVESFTDQTLRPLRFCGGGARSDGWAQILADVMGRPVRQLESAHYAGCRIAAFLAFERLGMVELEDVDKFSPVRREYAPRPEHRETYDRLYEQFLCSLRSNAPIFEALNR